MEGGEKLMRRSLCACVCAKNSRMCAFDNQQQCMCATTTTTTTTTTIPYIPDVFDNQWPRGIFGARQTLLATPGLQSVGLACGWYNNDNNDNMGGTVIWWYHQFRMV